MTGSPNATFITLIPKKDSPKYFYDYLVIHICNLVYNMVTKIIANKLKPKLSEFISKEQFVFLDNRKILHSIGTTQECIHTLKTKHKSYVVMKLDLAKAYGKVNWDFLSLVLLQIGITEHVMSWIMACSSSANFAVLINGSPTYFFKSSRGLRQGLLLSPLIFLLVIEGISK